MSSSVANISWEIMTSVYHSVSTIETENMAPQTYRDATRIQIEEKRQEKRLSRDLKPRKMQLQTGALAKMIQATTGVIGMDFNEQYKDVAWTTKDGSFNRHNGLPDLENMPVAFQLKYENIFKYAQFFQKWIKPILAELIATFMLVFWACMLQPGSADPEGGKSPLVFALAAGINLTIIITMFWDICIIQFNPCMTVAFVLAGVVPRRLLVPNIAAQLFGAYLAALFASLIRGEALGMIPITEESNINAVFWSEFFFTFMMAFVALAAVLDPAYQHSLTPLVIGLTVTQGVFGGWYVGAGCMNPARVFGPAAVTSDWNFHWIWWVSEIAGAVFAVFVEMMIFAPIMVEKGSTKSNLLWWRFAMWQMSDGQITGKINKHLSTWRAAVSTHEHDE